MSRARHRALVLWIAALDRTFERADLRGEPVLMGKCIHCNSMLIVAMDGEVKLRATIEHIVPQTHGGSDALENLALACGQCNGGKGVRLDPLPWGDPRLMGVIDTLNERRARRLRVAPGWLPLPKLPSAVPGEASDAVEVQGEEVASAEKQGPKGHESTPGRGRARGR